MRYGSVFVLILSAAVVTGCGVKQWVKGEYYLGQKQYAEGVRSFREELRQHPDAPHVTYYLGRLLLADDQPEEALGYLRKAAALDGTNADYHYWLGVAYSANKLPDLEEKSYRKALSLDPDHLKSRIYLAHTQLERKQYRAALAHYDRVLKRWPDEPASLYNRALALSRLGRKAEAASAWKEYLDFYSSGPMARRAVGHLNAGGDFSYRNHLIGVRTLTLRKIAFTPSTAALTPDSKKTLSFLGDVLDNARRVSIHIVSYCGGNKGLAEQRAKAVKKYLLERSPSIAFSRLKVAWFGVPEPITIGGKVFREDESVSFITVAGG